MKREIIQTKDGSTSILLPEWNETYHSKFGSDSRSKTRIHKKRTFLN